MQPWMKRLLGPLLGPETPRVPIFFRVRGPDGRPVPWVELEARFSPGNQFVRGKRHADASGTCLLHWPLEAESVAVRMSHGLSVAAVSVFVERDNPHRVVEVSLAAP